MLYRNLSSLKSKVNEQIAAGELDKALDLISSFVEEVISNPRSAGNVLSSVALDTLCQKIGAQVLEVENYLFPTEEGKETQLVVYIATELSNEGGHSAVIEDLIKAQPDKSHLIMITGNLPNAKRAFIATRFRPLVEIEWAPQSGTLDRLKWLQQQLVEKRPSQVFLFNHHHDAVAVAAVQPSLVSQLFFYHHADYQLCLGLHLPHARHIDFYAGSFYRCRHQLGITNNIFLPLVAEDFGERPSQLGFMGDGHLRTCTSGRVQKFEQPYLYKYVEEVPKIIEATGGVHIHIGYLSESGFATIKRGLQERGIDSERFTYIPWVKSIWRAMQEYRIDVYLNSFPYGGGRTMIEVMGSGTPAVVHDNYQSRIFSDIDIAYPEAFCWRTTDELYSYLRSLTPENLAAQALLSRKYYELYHANSLLKPRLTDILLEKDICSPPPLRHYVRDDLQVFLEESVASGNLGESFDKTITMEFTDIIEALYEIFEHSEFFADPVKVSKFLYLITSSQQTQNQLQQLRSVLQQNLAEQEQVKTQLSQTETNLSISQNELQETQEQLKKSQIQRQETQEQLKQSQAQQEQTEILLELVQAQLHETETVLEQFQNQLHENQQELERSEFQHHQAQRELGSYQSQLYQTQEELKQSRSQFQETQDQLKMTKSQLEQAESLLEEFQAQQHEVDTVLEQFQAQLQEDREKLGQSQIQQHQTQEELKQSQSQFLQTQEELKQSQNQFLQTQEELKQSQNQFLQTQEELKQSQSQFLQTQEELTATQAQLHQSEALLAEFQAQQHEVDIVLKQFQAQLQEGRKELEQSHSQLHQMRTNFKRSQSQLYQIQRELEQSHAQAFQTQEVLEQSQSQLLKTQEMLEQSHVQLLITQGEVERSRIFQAITREVANGAVKGGADSVVAQKSQTEYALLVWDAWYAYQNGELAKMRFCLQQSLKCTPFSRTETILNWLESFTKFSADKGYEINTESLTSSAEWEQLMRQAVAVKPLVGKRLLAQ